MQITGIELGSYHKCIEGCQPLLKQNHFPAVKAGKLSRRGDEIKS